MIRAPDNYHSERLVNTPYNNSPTNITNIGYTEQMKIAIEISKQDYSDEMEELEQQQILENYQEQCKQREKEVESVLLKLKKVSKYDKEIIDILYLLEDIFQSYTKGYIDFHYFENNEYKQKLWKNLLQIRFTEEEKTFLKNLLR